MHGLSHDICCNIVLLICLVSMLNSVIWKLGEPSIQVLFFFVRAHLFWIKSVLITVLLVIVFFCQKNKLLVTYYILLGTKTN